MKKGKYEWKDKEAIAKESNGRDIQPTTKRDG